MADEALSTKDKLKEDVLSYLSIVTDDEEVLKNINLKIIAVKQYLIDGGATYLSDTTVSVKDNIVACIAIGVNDLLNNKAGETKFSPAFNIIAMQVCRGS